MNQYSVITTVCVNFLTILISHRKQSLYLANYVGLHQEPLYLQHTQQLLSSLYLHPFDLKNHNKSVNLRTTKKVMA